MSITQQGETTCTLHEACSGFSFHEVTWVRGVNMAEQVSALVFTPCSPALSHFPHRTESLEQRLRVPHLQHVWGRGPFVGLGSIYMFSGNWGRPTFWGNFIKCLYMYEKKLPLLAELELTLPHHSWPFGKYLSFFLLVSFSHLTTVSHISYL